MDTAKSIFKSKTFWYGLLKAVIAAILLYFHSQSQLTNLQLGGGLSADAVLMIALRYVTKVPVTILPK
jgi:hypothetical protein